MPKTALKSGHLKPSYNAPTVAITRPRIEPMTDHQKYQAVNGQWPETMPALEPEEAVAAARRLYRFAMKKAWRGKWALTSGNRYTWPRGNTFRVNPNRTGWGVVNGWHDLVHCLSHYCHRQLFPQHKPHHATHHFIEKENGRLRDRSGLA